MSATIVWFRQDLRLADNPGLLAAPSFIEDAIRAEARRVLDQPGVSVGSSTAMPGTLEPPPPVDHGEPANPAVPSFEVK